MAAYIHCIIIYYVGDGEFWTCCQVYAPAETILCYNVQNIDATTKSLISKKFTFTK